MKSMKQALALLLCFLMLFSTPVNALATGSVSDGDIVIIETENTTCEECGSSGAHTEECALYATTPASTACSECGLEDGHAEICSQYEAPASSACTECGMESGHAEICSLYEAPAAEGCSECGAKEGHAETCSQYEAPAPVGCAECGQEEGHTETCSQYEDETPAPSVYDQLIGSPSLESFRAVLLAAENREAVLALTAEEIEILMAYIEELYAAIEDPTEDEDYFYEELIETLTYLPAMECPECGEFGCHADDCVKNLEMLPDEQGAITINANTEWVLTGDLKITGTITINSGRKLTITGEGEIIRGEEFTGAMFSVKNGATLEISAGSRDTIVINGNNIKSSPVITVTNDNNNKNKINYISLTNVKFMNCSGSGKGAAIALQDKSLSELTVKGCTFDSCQSVSGAAIYFISNLKASADIRECLFIGCTTTEGGVIRTNGGGGVHAVVEQCVFEKNTADASGSGGAIYWNACGKDANGNTALMEIYDCQFIGNSVKNYGGAVYNESFMEIGTRFANGFDDGQKNPGSIRGTLFKENHAAYGGAIDIPTYNGNMDPHNGFGAELTLSTGVLILGNTAKYGGGLSMRVAKGSIGNTAEDAATVTFKINIDGAEIRDNSATEKGGAIYLQRTKNYDLYPSWVNLKSGIITGNTAPSGGAICVYNQNQTPSTKTNEVNIGSETGVLTIANNKATGTKNDNGFGGAIYISYGNVNMSNGIVQENSAQHGGAICVDNGQFAIDGGSLLDNTATNKGGAAYVKGGDFSMNGSNIKNNAAKDGGAIYVDGGNVTVDAGVITTNASQHNGGAIYVSGGSFTLNSGEISTNTATVDGGAVYVTGGNFTMLDGEVKNSTALNGGAVYISGGNFDMISGKLLNNGSKSDDHITEYGGAVYVDGGNITVGVENCTGAGGEGGYHTSTNTNKSHPIIKENIAQYGGAFAVRGDNDSDGNATTGKVTVYCSFIKDNQADNEGTGHNIYMDGGGLVHYLNSAEIGSSENHEIVTIGGQLQVVKDGQIIEITLIYDPNASAIEMQWTGKAPEGYHLNLPYCPKNWQEIQAKPENGSKAFVGWSHVPTNSNLASEVRNTGDYLPVGTAIEVEGDTENKMVFYAVWAPLYNSINYAYTVDGENIIKVNSGSDIGIGSVGADDFSQYTYDNVSYNRNIPDANKSGYKFIGWLIYADTTKISNWNADPVENCDADPLVFISSEEVKTLSNIQQPSAALWTGVIDRNFGDVTLVAIFEPQFTDLTIIVQGDEFGKDPNQSFIFTVSGKPLDDSLDDFTMEVVITADKEHVTVKHLPIGDYTVTEKTGWSWRYDVNDVEVEDAASPGSEVTDGISFTMLDPEKTANVTFTQSRTNPYWLSGDAYCANWWTPADGVQRKED